MRNPIENVPRCYRCEALLTDENESDEHVIPNSIGGHLVSNTLLCISCNPDLSGLDAAVASVMNLFMVLFDPKRDRRNVPHVVARDVNRNEVSLIGPGKKASLKSPIVEKTDGVLKVRAGTKKRLRQELERLKKAGENIDIEKTLRHATIEQTEISSIFHTSNSVSARDLMRGIAKISVNYYLHEFKAIEHAKPCIQFVLGASSQNHVFMFGSDGQQDQRAFPYHWISITGSSSEKLLYSYTDFFGIIKSVVILNNCYSGPDIAVSRLHGVDGWVEDISKTYKVTSEQAKILLSGTSGRDANESPRSS
jgi:hypothetical protein